MKIVLWISYFDCIIRASWAAILLTATIASFTLLGITLCHLGVLCQLTLFKSAGSLEAVVGLPGWSSDVFDAVGIFKDVANFLKGL